MPRLPYPAILLYHEVGNGRSPYLRRADLHITPERFRRHVELLARSYEVVSVREVYKACRDGRKLEDTIAFSFDDGNKGILDAFRVLEQRGFPATAYINPDFASGRDVFWRSKLSYLIETGRGDQLCGALRSEFGEQVLEADIFPWTKAHVTDERVEQIANRVFAEFGDDDLGERLYATWDELRSVNRELFTFGNHTRRHSCMAALSPDEQKQHIAGAKNEIDGELGDDEVGLSIPFGEPHHYDATTVEISSTVHGFYLSAYGGINVVGLGKELKRIGIPNTDASQLPRLLWRAVVG